MSDAVRIGRQVLSRTNGSSAAGDGPLNGHTGNRMPLVIKHVHAEGVGERGVDDPHRSTPREPPKRRSTSGRGAATDHDVSHLNLVQMLVIPGPESSRRVVAEVA